MPGEFYVENKAEKVSLETVESSLAELNTKADAIKVRTDNLAGENPWQGATTADWQTVEANVVSIGAAGIRNKIHDLTLSIHNLVGTQIRVRLYKKVNGTERKVYEQSFDATSDPVGLPIINGSWAIHGVLRVTLQSNNAADNGKAVDYDYMLEKMLS
ncbi:hypothetical protein ASJ33_04055 [Dehalococcoides mccartyi]|uniref:hypothetical protein n=1 Tax=Dehalococcoides mccartyi TaxID=61435 RepID=UPI000909E729|nr:hypothetical protein [Dehalococcoides mccartyi]APH12380.1 hypothetical protein ASJ33_04055 [Dehalococcoides mccartyi]